MITLVCVCKITPVPVIGVSLCCAPTRLDSTRLDCCCCCCCVARTLDSGLLCSIVCIAANAAGGVLCSILLPCECLCILRSSSILNVPLCHTMTMTMTFLSTCTGIFVFRIWVCSYVSSKKVSFFNRYSIIFAKTLAKSETFVMRPKYFCHTFARFFF